MTSATTAQIIAKAQELGATLAGIASIELLKTSPSHRIQRHMRGHSRESVHSREMRFPPEARSALVFALSHPRDRPELDWWNEVDAAGNRVLARINRRLSAWIEETLALKTHPLSYSVEDGGAYLKDAAVLAGLGSIGRNNLLITPQLGPRVRLRAMLLEEELEPTGPIAHDPCDGCDEYCRQACPQNAYGNAVFSPAGTGIDELPGRDGHFSRASCMRQMDEDAEKSFVPPSDVAGLPAGAAVISRTDPLIAYCRRCELACPIGA